MPFIKSFISKRRAYIILTILLLGKIISLYSYYTEKKLVYIIITALSSRQPSLYTKYMQANI